MPVCEKLVAWLSQRGRNLSAFQSRIQSPPGVRQGVLHLLLLRDVPEVNR